jgi:hypothetical protein
MDESSSSDSDSDEGGEKMTVPVMKSKGGPQQQKHLMSAKGQPSKQAGAKKVCPSISLLVEIC